MSEHLDRLARGYQRSTNVQSRARAILGQLAELNVDDIFEEGMHEFLTRFIRDVGDLAALVNDIYLSGDMR
jgi:uncharacterized alpha-E superfamily protein